MTRWTASPSRRGTSSYGVLLIGPSKCSPTISLNPLHVGELLSYLPYNVGAVQKFLDVSIPFTSGNFFLQKVSDLSYLRAIEGTMSQSPSRRGTSSYPCQ